MANSGYFRANGVTYDNHIYVDWQLASQDVANNRSLIRYQAYAHFNRSDSQLDAGFVNSNVGELWRNNGRVKNYDGNHSTKNHHLASGEFWVNHRNDGNAEVQFSCGISFYGWGRSEGTSGVWSLPTIPRASNPSWVKNVFTVGETLTVNMNRKASHFTHSGTIQIPDGQDIKSFSGVGDSYSWTPNSSEIDAIYARMPNQREITLGADVATYNGNTHIGNGWSNVLIRIKESEVKPLFSQFVYKDINPTTTAITGDNNFIIQGQSDLAVEVLSANKAIARKSATMRRYNIAVANINTDVDYGNGVFSKTLGKLGVNSDADLIIKAFDSRGLFEQVKKRVKVLPYVEPRVVASATRVNNFETRTKIHIEGEISRLTISNTDKNTVNTASGVQYRFKKTTSTSWSGWRNVSSSTSGGRVSTTDFYINDLDRNFAWDIEYKITDRLKSTVLTEVVSVGIPIARIGIDGYVYNREQPLMASHVGLIIATDTLDTPAKVEAVYGGKWILHAEGRVIVGVGNNGSTNYATSGIKAGSDNIVLTTQQLPSHRHTGKFWNGSRISLNHNAGAGGYSLKWDSGSYGDENHFQTGYTGSNAPVDIRSKLVTAYFWKRVL